MHHETTDYVNNLLVNNFVPTIIIMPSRVTANTASIIDHIYYYEGSNSKIDLSILAYIRKLVVRFN